MKITHLAKECPYDGNNPNNCDYCGVRSATWFFEGIRFPRKDHRLCPDCRKYRILEELSIISDKSYDYLNKKCWYYVNYESVSL